MSDAAGRLKILSIIILSYKEKDDTLRCLASLSKYLDERTEVIVVDNGSNDGTLEALDSIDMKLKVLALTKNIGVGPGRNYGIQHAAGEYIMILDNDTVFYGPEPIAEIERLFSTLVKPGIVGFRLENEDGSIQRSFRRFPVVVQPFVARLPALERISFLRSIQENYLMTDIKDDDVSKGMEVEFLIGANQVFRKDVFLKVGPYDEKMFYGAEDCEICVQFKKHGYRNYYFPTIRIAHLYKRRSKHSMRLFMYHLSSFYYMFRKHGRLFKLFP